MTNFVVLLRSMQSSSTDGDIGSEGEATCPVSVATHLILMTPVTAFQVLLWTYRTLFQGFLNIVLSGGLESHSGPSFVGFFVSSVLHS